MEAYVHVARHPHLGQQPHPPQDMVMAERLCDWRSTGEAPARLIDCSVSGLGDSCSNCYGGCDQKRYKQSCNTGNVYVSREEEG
ncbi:hypothetical protein KC19_4G207200 [Ceratodon purpureus]|uniref:Uncharacterized protein n=1 Tax=Ceratodon purpureus TaxID=3225 RepID=A0A8T0IAX3_CERPU|nr:hypothetical protein KC19_4G207200 [Ceratodon purpureus]